MDQGHRVLLGLTTCLKDTADTQYSICTGIANAKSVGDDRMNYMITP